MNRRFLQGLGELPADKLRERAPGPVVDPGAGLIPEWINNYTATLFPFSLPTNDVTAIPANPLRCYLLIQNKDAAADLLVNFGNVANSFSGVIIIPRGNYELIGGAVGGSFCPSNSVHLLATVANQQAVIIEGVLPPVIPGA